ncbi:MAG: ABC transporter substrate-binding protein [Butyrivibrio sp.]|nr:ABC transporter substrate-binding protein [Butyrivibrio sp.]
MKKNFWKTLTATLALTTMALTGCGSQPVATSTASAAGTDTAAPITLRVGVSTNRTPHLVSIVAEKEGIYAKHNLVVVPAEFSSGIETVNAIELGQVDLGYVADFGGFNRLGNLADPSKSDLRFFARLEKTATMSLYANPDNVSSAAELRGKTIGISKGTVIEYFNKVMLDQNGIGLDEVTILPVEGGAGLALAERGDVDAIWAGVANKSKYAEYGFEEILTQNDLGVFQNSLYVTTQTQIDKDTEGLVRYLQATQETYDFIGANFDTAVADIVAATGMEQAMAEDALHGTTLTLDYAADLVRDLKDLDQWMKDNGYYENSLDLKYFTNTEVLRKALPDAEIAEVE